MAKRPKGWHTVTPRLVVADTAQQVTFLRAVFDATGDHQAERPSEIRIGDSIVMVSGPEAREPMPSLLYVYVDDADATHARAIAAGAESLESPADMPYGDRRATVRDPCGNMWQIAARR